METKPTDQVKVSKLTIQIGRTAVPLTIEQARMLRNELDALFGQPSTATTTKEIIIRRDYWPYWWGIYTDTQPVSPNITWAINTSDALPGDAVTVWCSAEAE